MTVSLYNLYKKSCVELARSLVIKSEATARAINKHDELRQALRMNRGLPRFYRPEDPTTWRYYMHLAGQYHPFDDEYIKTGSDRIMISSMDDGSEIAFTVENLKIHRATWREYQKGSTYYQNLIKEYPELVDLINGILHPIDIQRAIQAKDNEILWWGAHLVEANEYSLIQRIQRYIDAYYGRWDNPDYELTDDLYAATKIGLLYLQLPIVIMNARYECSRTIEAHSFHVWAYLGSHQHLDVYRHHLTNKQALWLYRNIRYVEHNPGKMRTFKRLIDIIMTERRLPIAEFHSELNYENMVDSETFYPDVLYHRNPLNLEEFVTKSGAIKTTSEIVKQEIPEAKDNDRYYEEDIRYTEKRMTRSPFRKMPTKVLESLIVDASKRSPIKEVDVELNTWIYLTTQGIYNARITVTNPKTADILNLNQNEALIVFVYATCQIHGIDPVWIPSIVASNVLRKNKPNIKDIAKVLDFDFIDPIYLQTAYDLTPSTPGRIISTEKFAEYVKEVIKVKNLHRNLYVYASKYREHLQIRTLVDQFYQTIHCDLYPGKKAFLDYFQEKGWVLDGMNKNEYYTLAADIAKYALGNDLITNISVKEIQAVMLKLLSQLSSYSVQFLKRVSEEDITVIDWQHQRLENALSLVRDKRFIDACLVNEYGFISRLFHRGDTLFGNFITEEKLNSRVEHQDKLNLFVEIKENSKLVQRMSFRLPTVSMQLVSSTSHVSNPPEDRKTHWDLTQFHIHKSTEERSRVSVDEETNELIVRGVVYVPEDFNGKE